MRIWSEHQKAYIDPAQWTCEIQCAGCRTCLEITAFDLEVHEGPESDYAVCTCIECQRTIEVDVPACTLAYVARTVWKAALEDRE